MRLRLVIAVCLCLIVSDAYGDAPVEFNRDIRPILSDKCFACHGPDEKTREADLRLDDRKSALADLDGHRAIVEGNAKKSELIRRITTTDDDELMPPGDHGKPLKQAEIELLRTWINQGAKYQQHWSLTPLVRPAVPANAAGKSVNPIDAFIQRKLKQEGVGASSTADPRTLVRRLSFDLTGLPPAPAVVTAFSANPSPAAYAKLADEFLNSPHYGERMALYWLDLVRYADTLGYHGDQVQSVSPYRDYVINAFNSNKPFNDFTTEQLAGDLLPEATLWQKVASTYNRLNRTSAEGGVQPREYLAKYAADRVRTAGSVWLGSTFGCAECHDHKFDPFTTKDFYRFAAFFADIKEQGIVSGANHVAQLPVPTEAQAKRLDELNVALRQAEKDFARTTPELQAARTRWEQEIKTGSGRWTIWKPKQVRSEGGAKLKVLKDGSVLASGKNPGRDVYVLDLSDSELPGNEPFALRIEILPDKSLPRQGPGRASNGNLVLNAVEMTVNQSKVKWEKASASHSQQGHSPENVINGHKHGWAILPQIGKRQQLLLAGQVAGLVKEDKEETAKKPAVKASCEIRLVQNFVDKHNIGRFRVSYSPDVDISKPGIPVADSLQELVKAPAAKRSAEQVKQIDVAFRNSTALLSKAREQLAKLRQEKDQLQKVIVKTLATTATKPRAMRVLPRGDWMSESGEVVTPGVPHFLSQIEVPKDQRATRLDLARWMTSQKNPLVARTFVNRLWMLMFGQGLARSVDDLGSQGEMPTHLELLDWLAGEFVESGWDVKHMVRLMVSSQTYQQTSALPAALSERDPFNRLYARQSRWRLEAEMIRDNALFLSGLLNREIGGVSVRPYQPAGYWAQLNFPKRTYQQDAGSQQYRRGLYTHWQRTFLHPSLLAFDAPAREECTAQRPRSNTPLQSLVLLNDPTFVESARVLAARVLQESQKSEFEGRLNWLTQHTLMRAPRKDELTLLKSLYEEDLKIYRKQGSDAKRILSVGLAKPVAALDAAELAAWTSVTRAILNLHETITRY
ncbi:MAG: PSD1 and planctomycete cytochrome C domain-containing protein [Planctomycetes bacterium]|nr:PSD1 and planctomycete cytochrome C domain-containing protein [Planctomycetota bacterium]MCH9724924.1 PSD1 and planctomycete cytochrome C domain-containing protein [Planctomycetota bacterium]MCH9776883.1 PSD1 and planctomycete cytochrome C domain-containing protein [Planctomycetota bacterium]MCH9790950.1 PSD1 and planctomycete cytochrome C domain-containing protein [Planctomycetota bacterium]